LAQIPQLIFDNQVVLTKSGRSEQNTIDIAQAASFPGKYLVSRGVNLTDPKTKTVQNIFKNTQKILVDGCYLIFEKYLQEETPFYIRNCAKKQAKV